MRRYYTNSELNELMSEGTGHFGIDYATDEAELDTVFEHGLTVNEQWEAVRLLKWFKKQRIGTFTNRDRLIAILIATRRMTKDFTVFAGYKKKEESRWNI